MNQKSLVSILVTILLVLIFTGIICCHLIGPSMGVLVLRLIKRSPTLKSVQGKLDVVKCHSKTHARMLTCYYYRERLCKILQIMLGGKRSGKAKRQHSNYRFMLPWNTSPDFTFIAMGKFCFELCKIFKKASVA